MSKVSLMVQALEGQLMALGMAPSSGRRRRSLANRTTWALQQERREPNTPRKDRPRCGAMTRKGTPCEASVEWDDERAVPVNGRCRFHGGQSTGPRTDVGRDAIRESNRRRAVLHDLAELVPEQDDLSRSRWVTAILVLARTGNGQTAAEELGVSRQTIARWRHKPAFAEAERRAAQRSWREWRRRWRAEQAARWAESPIGRLAGFL